MADHGWVVIPRWEDFQHYHDRDPTWIKNYPRQLRDDAYRALSGHQRAVLHDLRLEYASCNGQLRASTGSLTARLALRVSSRTLETLVQAGFIQVSASRPLALRARSQEAEEERPQRTKDHTPPKGREVPVIQNPTPNPSKGRSPARKAEPALNSETKEGEENTHTGIDLTRYWAERQRHLAETQAALQRLDYQPPPREEHP